MKITNTPQAITILCNYTRTLCIFLCIIIYCKMEFSVLLMMFIAIQIVRNEIKLQKLCAYAIFCVDLIEFKRDHTAVKSKLYLHLQFYISGNWEWEWCLFVYSFILFVWCWMLVSVRCIRLTRNYIVIEPHENVFRWIWFEWLIREFIMIMSMLLFDRIYEYVSNQRRIEFKPCSMW